VDYCYNPQCFWVWRNSDFLTPFSYIYIYKLKHCILSLFIYSLPQVIIHSLLFINMFFFYCILLSPNKLLISWKWLKNRVLNGQNAEGKEIKWAITNWLKKVRFDLPTFLCLFSISIVFEIFCPKINFSNFSIINLKRRERLAKKWWREKIVG